MNYDTIGIESLNTSKRGSKKLNPHQSELDNNNKKIILNLKKSVNIDNSSNKRRKKNNILEYTNPIDQEIDRINEELELDKRDKSEIDNKKLMYQVEEDLFNIEKIVREDNFKNNENNKISILDIVCFILKKNNKRFHEIEILKIFFLKIERLVAMFKTLNVSLNDMMGKLVSYIKYEKKLKDNILFKEGDKGDKFYIILKGEVGILIQQEKVINCTPIEYLKYLMILYLYTEKSLINKMIYANRDNIHFDFKCFQTLMDIFKFYHFYKEYYSAQNSYRDVIDFINAENKISKYLNKKNDFISVDCFHLLDLSNTLSEELYNFYCRSIEKIQKLFWTEIVTSNINKDTSVSNYNFSNPSNLYELCLYEKSHEFDIKRHKSEEFFEKLYNINEISNNLILLCTVSEYINRTNCEEIIKIIRKDSKNFFINMYENKENYKYYNYFEVNHLKDGNIFGELALINPSKKRTATVIIKEDCYLGVLNKEFYDISIKNAQDKLRKRNLLFFTKGPIFKGISNNYFLNCYFFRFKKRIYNSGEILFHRGEKRNKIYFIISGELQLCAKLTLKRLSEIIKYLNEGKEKDDGGLSNTYCKENIKFKRFYEEAKNNLRFYVLKDKEIAGLDDMTENNFYLFDCKCVSLEPTEVYELDYGIFEEASEENPVKRNNENYVSMKKQILLHRLYCQRDSIAKNEYNRIKTYFVNLNLEEIFKIEEKKSNDSKNKTPKNFFSLNATFKKNYFSISDEYQNMNTNFNNTIFNNTNINILINNTNINYFNKKFPILTTSRDLSSYKSAKNKNYNKMESEYNDIINLKSIKSTDLCQDIKNKGNIRLLLKMKNTKKNIEDYNNNNKLRKRKEIQKNENLVRILSPKNGDLRSNNYMSVDNKKSKIKHIQSSKSKFVKVKRIMTPSSYFLKSEFNKRIIEPNIITKNKNKFLFDNQKIFEPLIKKKIKKSKKFINITLKKYDNTITKSQNETENIESSFKNKRYNLLPHKNKILNLFKNKMMEENYKDIFFIDCLCLDKWEEKNNKNNEKKGSKLRGKKLIK